MIGEHPPSPGCHRTLTSVARSYHVGGRATCVSAGHAGTIVHNGRDFDLEEVPQVARFSAPAEAANRALYFG